jgi:hypothetical protein
MTTRMLSDSELTQEGVLSRARTEKIRVMDTCSDHRILLTHVAVIGLAFAVLLAGMLS